MKKIIFFLIAMFIFFNSKVHAGGYVVEYETPTLGTAIGDLTRDVASIPGNVISGTFGGLIDGFSGQRRTYRTRVVVPSYDGWNGYRPNWLNGPYPAAIGVPVYSQPAVQYVPVEVPVERTVVRGTVREQPAQQVVVVNNIYNNSPPPQQEVQAPAKKIKKARRVVHHPKGNF